MGDEEATGTSLLVVWLFEAGKRVRVDADLAIRVARRVKVGGNKSLSLSFYLSFSSCHYTPTSNSVKRAAVDFDFRWCSMDDGSEGSTMFFHAPCKWTSRQRWIQSSKKMMYVGACYCSPDLYSIQPQQIRLGGDCEWALTGKMRLLPSRCNI